MQLNQWIMFENDLCDGCEKPKVMKICPPLGKGTTLQVLISCDCDMTVFDHSWKHARDSGTLIIVVGETTVMDAVALIAETISKGAK